MKRLKSDLQRVGIMLALALQVATNAPVLRSVAVNVDAQGTPVEYGSTWFAGDRVTLTVNPD